MLFKKIRDYQIKSAFYPTWWSLITNPFYLVRRELFRHVSICSGYIEGNVLDVGCGSKPYLDLFIKSTSYVGLEYESQILKEKKLNVDFTYDGKTFPFEEDRFDSVVSFQVLEHVFEPEPFIREVKRVLKNRGLVLLTVPFIWDEHEQPYDYARYSSFGLRYLFEKNNFKVIAQKKTLNNFSAIIQLINVYLYKRVPRNKYIFYLSALLIFFPMNVLGRIFSLTRENNDFYMDNIIVLENVK